ncbi:MAG: HRDC domain-containing protein [Tannerella sp.]|nr:HRDC domain-containing protein [Tannerella sp.]
MPPVQDDIVETGNRFRQQVDRLLAQQPDVAQNAALQERIAQAARYFSEKTETLILAPLARADLDVDNKAVKKQLRDAAARLSGEAQAKYGSLCACLTGFDLAEFLHAKALAAIEKDRPGDGPKASPADGDTIEHPVLFERLRAWRRDRAAELEQPSYIVFSQKALYELAHYLPTDTKALMQINGIGAKKIERFGADIIEIIRDYCDESGATGAAEIPFQPSAPPEKPASRGEDTRRVSLDLFREKAGKIVDEIAAERSLTRQTVEGHLTHFIAEGELDAKTFLAADRLERIIDCFRETGGESLSAAKTALGDDVSYEELHIARAHLMFLENRERRE